MFGNGCTKGELTFMQK